VPRPKIDELDVSSGSESLFFSSVRAFQESVVRSYGEAYGMELVSPVTVMPPRVS